MKEFIDALNELYQENGKDIKCVLLKTIKPVQGGFGSMKTYKYQLYNVSKESKTLVLECSINGPITDDNKEKYTKELNKEFFKKFINSIND